MAVNFQHRPDDDWGHGSGAFERDWSLPTDRSSDSQGRERGNLLVVAGLVAVFALMATIAISLIQNNVW
jgi:hypothetical protein